LTISPTSAALNMPGYANAVQNFANVQVYTVMGGGDTATFTGSSNDDLYVSSPIGAQMFAKSGGSDISAWGFSRVEANAGGGSKDEVRFYTIAGSQDTFVASSASATYTGPAFENKANGFKMVQAYADPSTNSTATLIGSTGDDVTSASPLGMQLFIQNQTYDISVWSFRNVVSHSNGGHDVAYLFGSTSGTNLLDSDGQNAVLTTAGTTKTVSGFEKMKAFGYAGATDKATFDNAGLIENGNTQKPLDGSPYNHSMLLTDFDQLWTTAKPSVTTPVQHAVDQVMSTYWP
jgi:hypothetical protein